MSFPQTRLRRVEASVRGGQSGWCPECGRPPDSLGRVVYSDSEDLPDETKLDERCEACGRRLYFVIEVRAL